MNNVLHWVENNWALIVLVESTVMSFVPVKYNGLANTIWDVIQNVVTTLKNQTPATK